MKIRGFRPPGHKQVRRWQGRHACDGRQAKAPWAHLAAFPLGAVSSILRRGELEPRFEVPRPPARPATQLTSSGWAGSSQAPYARSSAQHPASRSTGSYGPNPWRQAHPRALRRRPARRPQAAHDLRQQGRRQLPSIPPHCQAASFRPRPRPVASGVRRKPRGTIPGPPPGVGHGLSRVLSSAFVVVITTILLQRGMF
jgi:hypothetical protein